MSVTSRPRKDIVDAASNVYTTTPVTSSGTSWVQVIASTSTTILVTFVGQLAASEPANPTTITLGIGGAGAEVTVFTGRHALIYTSANYWGHGVFSLPYPIRIPAGTRVALKTDTGTGSQMWISYVSESDVR